jgi:outer membrane protein assembly factor BamB
MHAFDVDPTSLGNGIMWQADGNQSFGASVVANGVVLVGTMIEHAVRAYDVDTGELLARLPMPASVSSSPVVVDGTVFVGSGDSHQPGGSGVHAFTLPLSALPAGAP